MNVYHAFDVSFYASNSKLNNKDPIANASLLKYIDVTLKANAKNINIKCITFYSC